MSFHVLVRGLKFINNSFTKMPQWSCQVNGEVLGGWGLSTEMMVNEHRTLIMTSQNTYHFRVWIVESCNHKNILSSFSLHLPLDYATT